MTRHHSSDRSPSTGAATLRRVCVLPSGSEYLVQLGWTREEARVWLADSALLASLPRGRWARSAIEELPTPGDDPRDRAAATMRASVYRELEALERHTRAEFLLAIAARLSRCAASLGSAGLALLIPEKESGGDSLEVRMAREGRRAQSCRLAKALRSAAEQEGIGVEVPSADPPPAQDSRGALSRDPHRGPSGHQRGDGPAAIARWLVSLARQLRSSDRVEMAAAEVELAFEGGGPARATLVRIGFGDDHASAGWHQDSRGEGTQAEPASQGAAGRAEQSAGGADGGAEAKLEDRAARILVLADLLDERVSDALGRLNAIPLLLDRSASASTLRAVAESRCAGARASSELLRDEFVAPVDGHERRRIARFLALAHGVPR